MPSDTVRARTSSYWILTSGKPFPDDESVNEALRVIAKAANRQVAKVRKKSGVSRRQTSRP